MGIDVERQTYDITVTAKRLGIGRNQAYEAAARGDIKTLRIGKRLLVPKAELDRLLSAGTGAGAVRPA